MTSGMIILDTNVLVRLDVTGPVAGMLRGIAAGWGLTLAISSVTRDEYHAKHLREFEDKIDLARRANDKLQEAAPDWRHPQYYPSAHVLVERKMGPVLSVFTVLPLDGSHAVEALRREAFRERPASVDKGVGARDVAIWLTAVEQSVLSDAPVYLLANDTRAFGKDSLHPELTTEAEAIKADVTLFTETKDLIDEFATVIESEVDIVGLLGAEAVTKTVRETMSSSSFMVVTHAITVGLQQGEAITGQSSGGVENIELIRPDDCDVYDMGGGRWIAARGTWTGHRVVMANMAGGSISDWEVKLEQQLTVLLRMFDDSIASAEVMGWEDPRILDIRRRHRFVTGTVVETETVRPITIK